MPIAKNTTSLTPHARLLAASFSRGTSASQLTALVVAWRTSGVDPRAIALILSSSMAAVLVSSVVAGWLMSRMAIGRVLTFGACAALCCIVALPFASPWLGSGQGVPGRWFRRVPASRSTVRQGAEDANGQASHAGMVTAALLAPMAFGPTLGAWTLGAGRFPFLASTALPMMAALLLVRRLNFTAQAQSSAAAGYAALLHDRRLWLPCASTVQSGLGYGFAVTFLPLMLANWAVPVAAFFGPFTVVLLVTRSYGLHRLRGLAVPTQVVLGLSACALSFGLLLLGAGRCRRLPAGDRLRHRLPRGSGMGFEPAPGRRARQAGCHRDGVIPSRQHNSGTGDWVDAAARLAPRAGSAHPRLLRRHIVSAGSDTGHC